MGNMVRVMWDTATSSVGVGTDRLPLVLVGLSKGGVGADAGETASEDPPATI